MEQIANLSTRKCCPGSNPGLSAANKQQHGVQRSPVIAPRLGRGGRRFESCHPDTVVVFQDNQIRGVAQPGYRAAFGTRRSQVRILPPRPRPRLLMVAQLSWIEHLPSKQAVLGSNPSAITYNLLIFRRLFCFWKFLHGQSSNRTMLYYYFFV